MILFLTKKKERKIRSKIRDLLKRKNERIKKYKESISNILTQNEAVIVEQKETISNMRIQIGDYKSSLSEKEKAIVDLKRMKDSIVEDLKVLKGYNNSLTKEALKSNDFTKRLTIRVNNMSDIIKHELK